MYDGGINRWDEVAEWPKDMAKYNIYEKEGAVFRGRAGCGFVTEVMTQNGWEPYNGDPCGPVTFGDFLRAEESDPGPLKRSMPGSQ